MGCGPQAILCQPLFEGVVSGCVPDICFSPGLIFYTIRQLTFSCLFKGMCEHVYLLRVYVHCIEMLFHNHV